MALRLTALRRMRRGMLLAPLAVLALVLRVMLPMAPMSALAAGADPVLAELLAGGGICHGDPDSPTKTPAQKGIACVLCPVCVALSPFLADIDPGLPAPPVLAGEAGALWPPATAPPELPFRPAHARAPPVLSA